MPLQPSWLATPLPLQTTSSRMSEQRSTTSRNPQPAASISFSVGSMSTRVEFADMQSFQDHGYQILGQAHMMSLIAQGYSQNTNVSSGLSSARPLPAWAIEPTSRAIGDQRTAGQLDVVQSTTMIPRQLQPQTQWPFPMDPSLPAEGWWQVNGVSFICHNSFRQSWMIR